VRAFCACAPILYPTSTTPSSCDAPRRADDLLRSEPDFHASASLDDNVVGCRWCDWIGDVVLLRAAASAL